jgi:hypothetical protein
MMTLAAVCVAATMNAQGYIGGSLGLDFQNKLIDKDGKDATGMFFQIKPELGYNLDEKSSVGIVLGFGVTNNTNEMINRNDTFGQALVGDRKTDKSAIQFTVAPYYRYKFVQFGNVDLFIDAQVGFTYTKYDEWNNTTFGVGVRPGVAYNANDKISFVAKLGNGLFFESSKNKDQDAKSKFGLSANTLAPLEIGMYYNF